MVPIKMKPTVASKSPNLAKKIILSSGFYRLNTNLKQFHKAVQNEISKC